MECRKVKCRANHCKYWAKSTKYAGCTFSQWHFRSLLRSYLAEVQDQIKKINLDVFLKKKIIKKRVRLIWSEEK